MRKTILRTATALAPVLAMGMAAPALAQNTEAAAEDETQEGGFGEIVVTAQGRDQLLQDVPVAITVVDSELIQNSGVTDVRGLRQLTPSLQSTTGQSSATGVVLSIRGIGTAGDNPGFEPAVGVFVDGVFRARAGLALSDMPELERVEVLRGPQVTLFGRNTSAGALSIVTAGPKFDLGGYVEAGYGNYNEISVKGGITGPLSDQLALRVDGGYRTRDGYIEEVNSGTDINDVNRYFVRGQLLYDNGSNVQLRIIGDYAETDELCCGAIHTSEGATGPAVNGITALFSGGQTIGLIPNNPPADRRVAFSPGRDLTEKVQEWGVSGQLDIDLGAVNITSITAYRDWQAERAMDIDFSGLDRAYREDYTTGLTDFTQELRFQGTAFGDKLDWMIGGFYLNETLTLSDTVRVGTQGSAYVDALLASSTDTFTPAAPFGFTLFGTQGPTRPFLGALFLGDPSLAPFFGANPGLVPQFLPGAYLPSQNGAGQYSDDWQVKTEAFSIFTHNILNLTDGLTFTFGVRYNRENKDISANLNAVNPACAAIMAGGSSAAFGQIFATQSALNPIRLLVCNPIVNPEFNGNYSDGSSEDELTGTAKLAYKIGSDALLFGSYSHGYKSGGFNLDRGSFDSRFFGGNGAQISDLQFGKETVDSFEIGLKTNLAPGFQFNVTGFYQDFTGYQNLRFEGSSFVVRQYDEVISQGVEVELGVRPADDVNMSFAYTYLSAVVNDPINAADDHDQQLTNQPENVFTGAITWTPELGAGVQGLMHIDFRAMSEANTLNDPNGVQFTRNGPYSIWNARLGVNFNDGKLGVEVYGQNIFDQYYNITSFPVPEQSGAYAVYPGQPRFYGVKVRAKF